MDAVPFRIVLEFLESHQFKLMGRKGTHRVFRRGNELIVIEVHDGKVSCVVEVNSCTAPESDQSKSPVFRPSG